MIKIIECQFTDANNAERAISKIISCGIKGRDITLSQKKYRNNSSVSAPYGIYGSFSYNPEYSLLSTETASADKNVLIAAGPYAGLDVADSLNSIGFVTDFSRTTEKCIVLKVKTTLSNLHAVTTAFRKNGGKRIGIVR